MGLYAKPPKAPDYKPLADAQQALGMEQMSIMREQLAQAKSDNELNRAIAAPAIKQSMEIQAREAEFAKRQQERYEQTFVPMEQQYAKEAQAYDTQGRREDEAGRATSEVGQAFDANTRSAQRDLTRFGIDPSMIRGGSLGLQASVQRAATQAQAGTEARRAVEATGRSFRENAINMGRGVPVLGSNSTNAALNAGQTASGIGINTSQSQVQGNQSGLGWGNSAGNSLTGAVNTLNTGFTNALDKYKASQELGPAGFLKGLAGAGIGVATGMIGKADGGPIKHELSPSNGAIPDDIPARLTAGEYVIPAEVVRWHGEKTFEKMKQVARDRQGAIPA